MFKTLVVGVAKGDGLLKSDVRKKLDDLLEKVAPEDSILRKGISAIIYRLKSFGRSLYELKFPLAAAATGIAVDRYLTYLSLGHGIYEEVPMTAATMNTLGEVPGMVVSGLSAIALYSILGKTVDIGQSSLSTRCKSRPPKNAMISASLYGFAATEAVVSLNNYILFTGPHGSSETAFLNGMQVCSYFLGLLALAPLALATAYYYIKSRRQKDEAVAQ